MSLADLPGPVGATRSDIIRRTLDGEATCRSGINERMIGMEGPVTVNEMTLTPVGGGTLLSILITYFDSNTRDLVLANPDDRRDGDQLPLSRALDPRWT